MLSIVVDGGVERYDDLHLDQIDPAWKSRGTCLDVALEAHRTALELRTAHNLNVLVVLAFSLNPDAAFPAQSAHAIEAALDWSPPSIYLFRRHEEPWRQPGITRVEQIDPGVLNCADTTIQVIDAEFRPRGSQHPHRSIYMAG